LGKLEIIKWTLVHTFLLHSWYFVVDSFSVTKLLKEYKALEVIFSTIVVTI
jgi:hypothetical protein